MKRPLLHNPWFWLGMVPLHFFVFLPLVTFMTDGIEDTDNIWLIMYGIILILSFLILPVIYFILAFYFRRKKVSNESVINTNTPQTVNNTQETTLITPSKILATVLKGVIIYSIMIIVFGLFILFSFGS